MSEKREVILEAKHVTRRFAASHGRTLLANNDIKSENVQRRNAGSGRRIRMWQEYIYEISGFS